MLVSRSARSLAALVWGDGSGCGAVQENLPLSFQTVCSKAAWPDLETRHLCAEGAACSLVAMDYETGVRFCSVGLFGIAKRCLFLLPLGEGGPKDRMRGGGLSNYQDRQVYPLTPTLSHWERGHLRMALGYHLAASSPDLESIVWQWHERVREGRAQTAVSRPNEVCAGSCRRSLPCPVRVVS